MTDPGSLPTLREWLRDRAPGGAEGVVAFARFLRTYPLNPATLPLYLDLFEAGLPEALEVILQGRDPLSLFAQVRHAQDAVDRVLGILTDLRPKETVDSRVLPLLGLLETLYGAGSRPADPRPLTVADVNQIGKHLVSSSGEVRGSAQRILDAVAAAPGAEGSPSHHARRVLDAYMDRTKGIETVLPPVLLR